LPVSHNGQIQIPVFAVVGSPKRHIVHVIEWEINSDIMSTEESARTLLLILNPLIKGLNHHLFKERLQLLRRWSLGINDSITVAICVSMEVTSDVLIGNIQAFKVNHLVTIFVIPEAIVPERILAAYIAPVAVIVLGVILTAS